MRTMTALMIAALVAAPAFAQPPGGRGGMRGGMGGNLLTNKSVQEELKLTDDQVKKVTEFDAKMQKDFPRPEQGTQRSPEEIKKMADARTTFTKETLTADQAKRFKEIQLQQGGVLMQVNNAEVATALKITDEQKTKLKEISDSVRKDMQEMFQSGGFDR
ncbi:MAG: Spy/CpxP family protein refolding chaperone, partial [Gemmataceae bacterium]